MAYVMIVDDDEDFAEAAGRALGGAGYEVHVHTDPDTAVENMERRRPDLVILDVMFPENSSAGFGLARTMRHYHEKLKDIPILMVTAVNQRFPLGFGHKDIDENWLPVTDFVEKPVDLRSLQNKVSALLSAGRQGVAGTGEQVSQ